ncbi:MAG: hypothetical protein KY475_18880 [Planctomycetes bacterium]|nr:hypothetical protein [Planctomycetota bacterium]
MMRAIRALRVVLPLVAAVAMTAPTRGQDALDLGNRRELFVDGRLIERLDGVALRLHKPRPANTVLEIDKPWEGNHNFGVGVLHHRGRYYVYYRAMPGKVFGKHFHFAAVALRV